MADIIVGDFVRWAIISDKPPPAEINANSPMLVTAVVADGTDARGGLVTVSREGREVGTYPVSQLVEVSEP